jgi:hypothetical protein
MEGKYANMYIQLANCLFRDDDHRKCYRLRQVVFCAEVALALELALELALDLPVCVGWAEVHLFLCVSSALPNSL